MKWGTFISFIFLVSFTESKTLPRRYRHVDGTHDLGHIFTELQEEKFKAVALTMFAQYVQKSTFEEVTKMVNDVTALAHKCVANKEEPGCKAPPYSVILDEICHEAGLPEKYGLTDCCAKADVERNECFLSHKNSTPGFIPHFKKPEPDEACKLYQENQGELLNLYIYELARRRPFLYASTVLSAEDHYDEMMKSCCVAEDKAACFAEKAVSVSKEVKKRALVEENTCEILKRFGERALRALKLIQVSQKFPKSEFATAEKIVTEVVHVHADCCRGDMLDCLHERIEMTNYFCSHQDAISSKLKDCCEKPVLEKGDCIRHLENDEKPADLSPTVREFIEDKDVCDRFAKEQDVFLAKFLHEYSKRHPEFSHQMLLRTGKGYQDLLVNCCQTSNPPECYSKGDELLKKHVQEMQELMKTNCDVFKTAGEYFFQNALLVRYTKKMPQLPPQELLFFTKQLAEVGARCCQLSEDKIIPCGEQHADLVIGQICRRHYANHINPSVCKCCSDSYALRRPCITELGIDEKYVPIPFSPDLFTFHEDLCVAEEKDLQRKKQELLIKLVKHKLAITDDQLKTIFTSFAAMREKCCAAENHEECFGQELIDMEVRNSLKLSENCFKGSKTDSRESSYICIIEHLRKPQCSPVEEGDKVHLCSVHCICFS